jgi:hypothetical protein
MEASDGRDSSIVPCGMPGSQQNLPGFASDLRQCRLDQPRRGVVLGYNLFLALFPDFADGPPIERASMQLTQLHQLEKQGTQAPGRFHVSLLDLNRELGLHGLLAQLSLDGIVAAINRLDLASFRIRFDRAERFDGGAFVLLCDEESRAHVATLRKALTVVLKRAGKSVRQSTTPHMSVHYRAIDEIASHAIEPLVWPARRLGLILSL